MTTLTPAAIRMVTPVSGGALLYGIAPFFTNWENFCSKPHWGPGSGIATLDRSIERKRGYCLSWGLGVYAPGTEPKSGDHPKWPGFDGYEVRCTPQGLEMFTAVNAVYPGWVEAFLTRNEVVDRNGQDSILYVGSLPLSTFSPTTSTATKNSRCDALLKPAVKAKFKYLGLDASAALAIKDATLASKVPTLWLAERAKAMGITPIVEAFPMTHPQLFPWANGRFAALCAYPQAPEGSMSGAGHFNQHSPGCFTKVFGWVQGSVPQDQRWGIAANMEAKGMTPIVDFGDMPEATWSSQ